MPIRVTLDAVLKARGLSIRRLATESGVTQANVWRFTRNKNKQLHMATLDAICKTLECQPGDFLVYETDQLTLPLVPAQQTIDRKEASA
jgi:putative transcriptional regulator